VDPDGDVAVMLLINLEDADPSPFTSEQRRCVISTARFLAAHTIYGPDDPVARDRLRKIKRTWREVRPNTPAADRP
jgi:hypothetical protein